MDKKLLINGILATAISIIVLTTIIYINKNNNDNSYSVLGQTIKRIEDNPDNYSGLQLPTGNDALASANSQINNMTYGNILPINSQDEDYQAKFYHDYSFGDIQYWEIVDSTSTVYILADTAEIIYYSQNGMVQGSLTEQQILYQADLIVRQFATLPGDLDLVPYVDWRENVITSVGINDDTQQQTINSDLSFWIVCYNRTKNNIKSEDHIQVLLLPNGDCSLYRKICNMDLKSVNTNYAITKQQAENSACNFIGDNPTVINCYKKISRPNDFYGDEGIQYGTLPKSVWEVVVSNSDGTYIVDVDKDNMNLILGGDYLQE
ncbi:MAG: hypothetical protein QCI82_05665 [Candidatus Thermoplasmatota archaeon]|nr:hypothetical protein [Candidatus Thermoplasmatota archaeon]